MKGKVLLVLGTELRLLPRNGTERSRDCLAFGLWTAAECRVHTAQAGEWRVFIPRHWNTCRKERLEKNRSGNHENKLKYKVILPPSKKVTILK